MPQLTVTPALLESLSGAVVRASADMRAQQQSLRGQLVPIFGAEWSGAAAEQFQALYGQFDAHAQGLLEALDGLGRVLGRAGAAYAEVEQQIAASFR